MFDTPSISDVHQTLHTLPDEIQIVDNAADGTTWVVYDGHLIAAWDPSTGKSRVRLHLREIDRDLVPLELDQFLGALQFLHGASFEVAGTHTVPPDDDGRLMEILIFEARDVQPEDLKEAIYWTMSASRPAFELSKGLSTDGAM